MKTTLLLVDDEVKILEAMSVFLEKEGYRIVTATTGMLALSVAQAENPALVVLDWMLPEMNGMEVCRELRKTGNYGIIMLTAKTEETDKIIGLEMGADDYMTKPFSLRELTARIRSVLRRLERKSEDDEVHILERGQLSINAAKCQVLKQGRELLLTPTELKILLLLAAKPGIVYSRLQIMKAAIEEDYFNYERTMDSHISNLRKKIEDDPAQPQYIQTVYGFGYRFGDRL